MPTPRVLILRAPGANCDREAQFAFEQAGAIADRIHVRRIRERPSLLRDYQILMLPGGFSYGDDVAAGKILAVELQSFLSDELQQFRDAGKLILGVCNGFQTLLKAGLLLPPETATLAHNTLGRFQDRWIHLSVSAGNCPFLTGLRTLFLPVAHGEGNFCCRDDAQLLSFEANGQVVLRYSDANGRPANGFPDNPNGSLGNVAGICDTTGRVFGLMPHPERNVLPTHHPRWTREGLKAEGDGLAIFRNAVANS